MRVATGAAEEELPVFLSDSLIVKDEGGDKGRGYYAKRNISAGELLLREAPHIFDAEEEDFEALAALHVLAAAEEGLASWAAAVG
ncbi:unnamed protein product [Effrenium voratum]|uniref:Uncharacterized protein n=1 Tax=Effrenium voratum TaxID=2562239 RepID=A0AA36HX00_9DINO|nr:unnamed protein product [Effrenium voratum]